MNPNLEIEYKMMISEENYLKLMKIYQKEPFFQRNIYYDAQIPLVQKGMGMRIRDYDGKHLFTLKEKTTTGHFEYEVFTQENSLKALEEKEVQAILKQLDIHGPFIETGILDTWRVEIACENGILCLDKNKYSDIIDYELEFELYPEANLELGKKELEIILNQVELIYIQNKNSKIKRCLDARRKK